MPDSSSTLSQDPGEQNPRNSISRSPSDSTREPGLALAFWRAEDKPRERLLAMGAHQVSSAELLAILLGTGSAGEDALALARRVLAGYGTLDRLLAASTTDLLTVRGLGYAKVARLKALHELTMRHGEEHMVADQVFSDVSKVARYIQRRIGYRDREVFGCLFLDTRHRMLAWEELFLGSVNRAHVYAREVLRRGLALNAAAVIFGHNHPSGVAEPSQADLQLTADLKGLLRRVDVEVLDHIVVSAGTTVSMAARGLLPR